MFPLEFMLRKHFLSTFVLFTTLLAFSKPMLSADLNIKFTEYDLPNGLHVILHQDKTVPVVATYVLYHVGSKDERADRTGFAHFFEHLMFEGSENIPRGQLDKYVSAAGGNLNASTSFDQTNYYLNLPANQLPLALWIESERMMHAKVESIGVETQRQVVKEERRMHYENQPYGSLFEEMAKLVFAGTPYAWVPIGSVQYIDQAKLEEFQEFYKKFYVPNNATLVVAGDFETEPTKKLIEAYFGPIARAADIPRPKVSPWELQTTPKSVEVKDPNTPLPATVHAWRVPPETHPDSYALDLLANVLANGRSSRLYKRLVDQEQVAVQAQAFPFLQEKAGMVGAFAMGNPQTSLKTLDDLITDEIAKVCKDGVTEEEYQKVRNQKESELAASYGTMHSRAQALAQYHVFYNDTNRVNDELKHYLNVTREDLRRVANLYLKPSAVNIVHYPLVGHQNAPQKAEPASEPAVPEATAAASAH